MKTKHYIILGALGIALTGAILTGCQKKNATVSTDTTAAQDDANASFAVEDTKNVADGAAKGQASDRLESGCEQIFNRDTVINAVKDTLFDVFFGDTNCSCNDGRLRRGHILAWCLPGHYFNQGDSIGLGFKDYYVNNIGITGGLKLFNVGKADSTGLFTWSFSSSLKLAYPSNGGTATWTSARTNTLTTVGGHKYYTISGNANGTSRKGATYNINITSPLYVSASWFGGCQYIESGQLTATVSSFSYPIYVTFGTALGTCTSSATATINGVTFNFSQE